MKPECLRLQQSVCLVLFRLTSHLTNFSKCMCTTTPLFNWSCVTFDMKKAFSPSFLKDNIPIFFFLLLQKL